MEMCIVTKVWWYYYDSLLNLHQYSNVQSEFKTFKHLFYIIQRFMLRKLNENYRDKRRHRENWPSTIGNIVVRISYWLLFDVQIVCFACIWMWFKSSSDFIFLFDCDVFFSFLFSNYVIIKCTKTDIRKFAFENAKINCGYFVAVCPRKSI